MLLTALGQILLRSHMSLTDPINHQVQDNGESHPEIALGLAASSRKSDQAMRVHSRAMIHLRCHTWDEVDRITR